MIVSRTAASIRLVIVCLAPLAVLLAVGLVGRDDTGRSGAAAAASAPSGANAVTVQQFQFEPREVTVTAGAEVVWANQDAFDHSIVDRGDAFRGDPFGTGENFARTYDEPGTYEYFCGIHNSMTGTVVVTG
jgi:plastocyanin